jgi:uncharacterized repeat protein (TIGR03803 family)
MALALLLATLGRQPAGAQADDVLRSLADSARHPMAGVILASDGYLYGTTNHGGLHDAGTLFRLSTSGDFRVIHSFALNQPGNGAFPTAGLIEATDGHLYGTTVQGGAHQHGSIYRLDGSLTFELVHSFLGGDTADAEIVRSFACCGVTGGTFFGGNAGPGGITGLGDGFIPPDVLTAGQQAMNDPGRDLATDGAYPYAGLIEASDGRLYGATWQGGANGAFLSGSDGAGTLYRLVPDASFEVLHAFPPDVQIDGAYPHRHLHGTAKQGSKRAEPRFTFVEAPAQISTFAEPAEVDAGHPRSAPIEASDGALYGTTVHGGVHGHGTVYRADMEGDIEVLHSFSLEPDDGAHPYAPLVEADDGYLYGTTLNGGAHGAGTVFRLDLSGNFELVHSFDRDDPENGARPYGVLLQASDGNLYGTTHQGGANIYYGTIYRIDTSGGFEAIHSFGWGDPDNGAYPYAGLMEASDGLLYGTTIHGGAFVDGGTVYRIDRSGSFQIVHSFGSRDQADRGVCNSRSQSGCAGDRPCGRPISRTGKSLKAIYCIDTVSQF